MWAAGRKECTAHMATERGQSRYYYFYYKAEVLWNSSLKQPAAKSQTPKKLRFSLTSVPNRNNLISQNTCYSTGILWNKLFLVILPVCGRPFAEAEGLARAISAARVYPWNPYTPLFRTLPCSHSYSDFKHTERLCWVKGVGVDYIYIHIFSIMIKQSGCTTATSTLLHLLITFVLLSTLSFICFIFC